MCTTVFAGTDDAHGILMALQAHRKPEMNFKLIGIVCVNGNTSLPNVCVNITRILEEMNATEVLANCTGIRNLVLHNAFSEEASIKSMYIVD